MEKEGIFEYISNHEEDNQKIFYDGQIFDSLSLLAQIIGSVNKKIVLIDGYIDVSTLNIKKTTLTVYVFYYLDTVP